MKKKLFDYVVGNPPYQEETKNTSDNPVYNVYMDAVYEVADKVVLVTPARFLFNAGKTPKVWNEKMLNDPHLKIFQYEADSSVFFPGVDIKGGVVITYRDSRKNFGAIKTFTAFPELNSILHKVLSAQNFKTLSDFIIEQNKWDLSALYADYPEYKEKIGSNGKERRLTTSIFTTVDLFREEKQDGCIKIIGLIKNKRVYRYIKSKYIDNNHENLTKWKIILPKSNGSGAIGEVLSTPLVGEPLVGYTQSFIGIGKFGTQDEAEACLKYIKSKFSRIMLGVLKVTQDNPRSTWQYVPLQNFTAASDIDWSKSIHEIDWRLYRKYGLYENEINFIENHVKEME